MRRPTLLTILLAVAILAGAGTSWARVVVTTSSGGNWNDTMSWIGPAPGPADDALILAGASVTVTANANVHSITFSNNSTATATITVNSGVTLAVAAGVTNQNSATANTSALLQGSGIITCTAITVGGTTTPTRSSSDFTATLTSTVSNLNDSGALTVRALYNSSVSSANQGTFALSSGTVTAPNVAFVTVPFFGPILTLATGSQSGTLILSNAAPFTFSGGGSSTFTPNGTNATVVYTGAAQAVSSATYQNLTFAGSGTKTNTGVTVNGLLLMQGTAKASVAPTYGSNATLEYNGSSLQTNGAELAALLPNLTISNASGVTLTNNTTISNVLTFVNGLIVTGSKNLIIGTNGSTSGGSSNSYVNGTLQKNFKVGTQTFFFPVGDTEFAPLTLSNLSVTAAGTILVSTQPGVPSQITSSGISTNQLVNRSWNLTNSGGTFGTYGATFNYPTNDVGTNAAPALFEVGLFNGGNFSYATVSGTPTTTSASISGESGFGTFAMGDPPSQATQLAITSINGGVSPVVGAPFTVTIQSQNGGVPSPVGQGTAIKLTLHSGSGVLGGTLVGTIPAWSNSVTITGVTYSVAQSGVQLTAAVTSGQSLSSTNSSSFTVIPQNQTITFPSPGNQTYGVAPITLTATASSGLPITYSVTSGPATVSGSVLTITGAGSVTIQAAQSGNVNWNAATPVSQTISVAQKTVTGSFTAKNKTYDGTLAATNATTGLSGVINSDVVNLTIGTVAFTDKNVGNGKTVIASGLGLSGANAGNYTLTSTSATNTANITAATLTVTANNTNRVYGVANPVFTASYSGFVNGENSSVLSGTPSVTSTATAGSSVAGSPYAITAAQGTLSAANYTFTFVNGNLTVTAAALTVTANNTNRVYGAANPAFTASYSGFVNGENSSVLSGAPSVTSTATAGSSVAGSPYAITATQGTLSAANYTFTFVNGNLTVTTAALTVTANNTNRVYGSVNPVFTASYSGFVNGENSSVLSGSPSVTSTATTGSSVAGSPYAITAAQGTLSAANYTFTFVNGNLTVTPAALTVTANNTNRVYGSANPVFTASYSGFVNGEDSSVLSGAPSVTSAATASSSVAGSPYAITATQGTLSAANYAFTFVNGNLAVTPASLTVTANDTNRVYGAANPTFTVSYSGFVNGENSSVLSGIPSVTSTATGGSSVAGSPYAITVTQGTLSAANYSFNFMSGSLSVTPATLTVTANNTNRVYGAANPTLSVSYSGFVNGDGVGVLSGSPSIATAANPSSSVSGGPYPITVSQSTLSAANYTFTFVSGNLTVTPASLTVTANNTNRIYGAANPVFTVSYSGFVNGEDSSVLSGAPSVTSTAMASSSVAGSPYAIVATQGTLSAANYTFNFVNGSLSVTTATLTVTANNTNRVYGAANPTFAASYSGFVNGENSSVLSGAPSVTSTATAGSSVGGSPYAITVTQGTLSAANYSFTFVNGNLTVTSATLTVTANNTNRLYGAANPVFSVSYSGFVNGENSSVLSGAPSVTSTATAGNSVAGSPYAITVTQGTLSAANYTFTFVNGNLTVTPATLTVTANNTNRVYGAANPTFSVNYSGFVNGENTSVLSGAPSLATTATPSSSVAGGPYAITATQGTLSAANYSFTFVNGNLTVTLAVLTVTANSTNRIYGATNPAFTTSYSGFVNGENSSVLSGAPSVTSTATAGSSVAGSPYAITATQGTLSAANYSFTFVNGNLTVTPAALTVTANNTNRVYGAANPAFTVSYSGFVNGENASVLSGAPSVISTATAGSGVAGSPYAITVTQGTLSAANYTFNFVNGNLAVTAAPLTVTANDTNRIYGAANPTFTVSYNGFVNGDGVGVLSGAASVATTATPSSSVAGGPYPITVSQGTLSAANYSFTFVNGNLAVTPATLTVTADNTNRVYGAANPAFTVNYTGFVNGENTSVLSGAPSVTSTATAGSSVAGGPYAITVTQGTLSAANYTFSFVNGSLSITAATLTVTANDTNRVYGAANPSFTVSYSGFANGDDTGVLSGTPSVATTASPSSPVPGGPYPIAVTQGTLSAANYSFTFVNGNLTIAPATLTVTANNTNRAYSAVNPLFTLAYSGFVNGEGTNVLSGVASVTTTAGANSPVPGSPYAIVVTQGSLSATNYTFMFVNGNLTVTPVTLTVSADNQSRSYGMTNLELTASYNGFVNGETTNVLSGSPDLSTTAVSNSAPGAYTIQIDAGTLSATNYVFGFNNGTLTVHSLPLVLTIQTVSDPTNAIVLSAPGIIPNITYQILGSTDMVNWAQIGIAQSGADGSLFYTNTVSSPSEFYRISGP